ncbi:MAG: hypothetical protein KME10_27580 [Plectolyngbya sp. WJT66-NPBG17]|jgi:hypothetical protein|nr:hypothetical protein [Plectolyngbya sp. WJT66-NPBG17]
MQAVALGTLTEVHWSVVFGLFTSAAAHSASWQWGYRWTASARDEPRPPHLGVAGVLERSLI